MLGNRFDSSTKDIMKFQHNQRVRFSDTDAAGIVYFGAFATYFDEAFLAALRSGDIHWEDHERYNFLLPIVEQKINFIKPLRVGDEVSVSVSISKLGNRSFTTDHEIRKFLNGKDELIAHGYVSRVVVDYNDFNPIEIPDNLRIVLKSYKLE